MMSDLSKFELQHCPRIDQPLFRLMGLVVEDSQFACEAIRLLSLRNGARICHADCLQSTRQLLQVYRPLQ